MRPSLFMEDIRREDRREKKEDSNLMGDISILESPRKNVKIVARLSISKETTRKRRKKDKEKNIFGDEFEKYSQEDGGDTFVASLETHAS
jgi:hypothetical protein